MKAVAELKEQGYKPMYMSCQWHHVSVSTSLLLLRSLLFSRTFNLPFTFSPYMFKQDSWSKEHQWMLKDHCIYELFRLIHRSIRIVITPIIEWPLHISSFVYKPQLLQHSKGKETRWTESKTSLFCIHSITESPTLHLSLLGDKCFFFYNHTKGIRNSQRRSIDKQGEGEGPIKIQERRMPPHRILSNIFIFPENPDYTIRQVVQ